MKVVAICGSPRLEGNSNYLADQALEVLKSQGIETEKFNLNQCKMTPCQGHPDCPTLKKCRLQDDIPGIIEKMMKADGLIIASPVYFFSICAQIKILLDRTYFLFTHSQHFKAGCYGLIAVQGSEGAERAFQEMQHFAGFPGQTPQKFFKLKASAGGPDKHVKDNPEIVQKARDLGRHMADFLLTADSKG